MRNAMWIPAARPDVISMRNVERLKARLILQGANIPITREAGPARTRRAVGAGFHRQCGRRDHASVEYHGGTQAGAFAVIREKILTNTRETLERSRCERITPRAAAEAMARERVERAMGFRRRQ
jgi:glutamate dehydrogenase (NAD(P)+)